MLPLTAVECISVRLLADRRDTAGGLRSAVACVPDARSSARSLECSESVGVECEGAGDKAENCRTPGDAASVFVNSRPVGFTTEGELVTTGGLHCSDTHCTCPGGRVFKPDEVGDPVLNFSKPRPRL